VASVLVISDDAGSAEVCRQALNAASHTVTICRSPAEAVRTLASLRADLLCLDAALGASEVDDFCRWLRSDPQRSVVPVLFLLSSASRWTESPLPAALRAECDDYLVRPLDLDELAEKAAALLTPTVSSGRARSRRFLQAGPFTLDSESYELWVNGRNVELTPTEFRLFAYLMERAGTPVSVEDLLENVWGYFPGTGAAEVVRAHVSNLRRKMARLGDDVHLLRTLPHRGYCLLRKEKR
jgi:two-component system OmpR family response regulator